MIFKKRILVFAFVGLSLSADQNIGAQHEIRSGGFSAGGITVGDSSTYLTGNLGFVFADNDASPLSVSRVGIRTRKEKSTKNEKELISATIPQAYRLFQNYPNPFNPSTIIRFDLPVRSQVRITFYDLLGRQVLKLVDKELAAGDHSLVFDAGELATGVYFYHLRAEASESTVQKKFEAFRKLMVLK